MSSEAYAQESRLRRVERVTELPMLLLALAYLPVFIVGYLHDVSPDTRRAGAIIEYVIVGVFAAELLVRLFVAQRKLSFPLKNWLDVVIVLLPFLRPMRFLRVARILPFVLRGLAGLRRVLGRYQGAYVILVGILSVLVGALLVSVFEQGSGGPIATFQDALWWAVTTITTVGYGDTHPVTSEGRLVASLLMVVGIALFVGVLTAAVAAYFVESDDTEEEVSNTQLMRKLEVLETRLGELEAQPGRASGSDEDRERAEGG